MTALVSLISLLQAAQSTSKVLHWKTRSFSQHLTLDELNDALSAHADRLAEVSVGLDPRALDELSSQQAFTLPDTSANEFISVLFSSIEQLAEEVGDLHDVLESILDDLMEDVTKARYKIEQLTS